MTAFINTARGGIQPINGSGGSTINQSANADRGKPGRDAIVSTINRIIAATQIRSPGNACDPQAAIQRTQQAIQQNVQAIIEQHLIQSVRESVEQSVEVQANTQQIRNLQVQAASGGATEAIFQQIEAIEKETQQILSKIIVGAVGRVAAELPQATKLANTSATGVKTIAAVAESLNSFVPSVGINMKNYSSTVKSIQTISQSCFI